MKIGVIGGQDITKHTKIKQETIDIETPYGNVEIYVSKIDSHDVFFIQRHGAQKNLPPHKINYRANIQAFANAHVEYIIALNTVGSLKKTIRTGDFVIPHDFIDFTKSRAYTFYDNNRVHIDMNTPYCSALRKALIKESKQIKSVNTHTMGIYLATEGPRLETPAEINLFSDFCDVVGMTGVPEVILAREKGICYASLCIVSNMAAGLQKTLSADDIHITSKKYDDTASRTIFSTIEKLDKKRNCNCKKAAKRAML